MSRRSYQQACPIASALDLLGERWTLIIVRDLLLGPLRFSDLLTRMPGLSRNLLASRLQHLQQEGLLHKQQLDPPAGSTVYALTDKGRALEEGLLALAGWSIRHGYLPAQPESGEPLHNEPDLLGLAFKMAVDPQQEMTSVHELVASGRPFHLRFADGQVSVRRGNASHFLIRLQAETSLLGRALFSRQLDVAGCEQRGELIVEGDRTALPRALAVYGINVV